MCYKASYQYGTTWFFSFIANEKVYFYKKHFKAIWSFYKTVEGRLKEHEGALVIYFLFFSFLGVTDLCQLQIWDCGKDMNRSTLKEKYTHKSYKVWLFYTVANCYGEHFNKKFQWKICIFYDVLICMIKVFKIKLPSNEKLLLGKKNKHSKIYNGWPVSDINNKLNLSNRYKYFLFWPAIQPLIAIRVYHFMPKRIKKFHLFLG